MKYLIAAFVLVSNSLYGQNAREIVNRYLDTVSNNSIENWDKIKSVYSETVSYYGQQEFEQKVDLLHADKPSFSKIYEVLPYQTKKESYDDSLFTRLNSTFYFLKDKIVMDIGNVPRMVKEAFPRDEFYSNHMPVYIWKLLAKSKSVELLGTKEFSGSGSLCYEVKITTKGRNYFLYINTETFLLEYWRGREDEDASFLAKYYDYKKVGEFLIPMSDCLMRNGTVYFWNHTRKVELNADIDQHVFEYEK